MRITIHLVLAAVARLLPSSAAGHAARAAAVA